MGKQACSLGLGAVEPPDGDGGHKMVVGPAGSGRVVRGVAGEVASDHSSRGHTQFGSFWRP